jgi:hypothetical protein
MFDLVMVLGSTLFLAVLGALIAVIIRKEWNSSRSRPVLVIWTFSMTALLGVSFWCLFLELKALLL